jgi:hypothetical protein
MLGMMELHGPTDMDEIEPVKISAIDEVEAELGKYPKVDLPLEHTFTPGIYTRKIFMPAGTYVVSLKHKTTHPFFILKGKVAVLKEAEDGRFIQEALYIGGDMGITKPNTKRFLYNIDDTIWVTCHSNPKNIENPDEIILNIAERTDNPLIDKNDPTFNQWKSDISPSLTHKELELPCVS